MKHVSVVSAFKFGFKTVFKNLLFFIWAMMVTVAVWSAGVIVSGLIAFPCFIPLIRAIGKVKGAFAKLVAELGAAKAAVAQSGTPFAVVDAQTLDKFKEVLGKIGAALVSLVEKIPMVFIFAVLGVLIFLFALWLVQMMLALGWCKVSLDFKDKGSSSVSSLFVRLGLAFKAVLLLVFIKFILLFSWMLASYLFRVNDILGVIGISVAIFFSIYFILKMSYSFYHLVDKDQGVIAAIKECYALKGGASRIFLFMLLMGLVNLAAILLIALFVFVLHVNFVAQILLMFYLFVFSLASVLGVGYLYRELGTPEQEAAASGQEEKTSYVPGKA